MTLNPTVAAATSRFFGGGLASKKVRLACPLFLGQLKESFLEEVLFAANVLSDGVGAVVAAAETRPFFGTQAAAAVTTIWIRT